MVMGIGVQGQKRPVYYKYSSLFTFDKFERENTVLDLKVLIWRAGYAEASQDDMKVRSFRGSHFDLSRFKMLGSEHSSYNWSPHEYKISPALLNSRCGAGIQGY